MGAVAVKVEVDRRGRVGNCIRDLKVASYIYIARMLALEILRFWLVVIGTGGGHQSVKVGPDHRLLPCSLTMQETARDLLAGSVDLCYSFCVSEWLEPKIRTEGTMLVMPSSYAQRRLCRRRVQ